MSDYTLAKQKLNNLLEHIKDGYAPNTIRAYRADMDEFIAYCAANQLPPLPVV